MKGRLSSMPYLPGFEGMQLQTVLGALWLALFPSARTCSLERSSGYALRSRARAEGKTACAIITPPGEKYGLEARK